MIHMTQSKGYSLVTLVLPEHSAPKTIEKILKSDVRNIMQVNARGTLLKEGGFLPGMFPPPAPKQQLFQMLVPNAHLEDFMARAVEAGHLTFSGAGAIYSMNCNEVSFTDTFNLWKPDANAESKPAPKGDKKLVNIQCIVERGNADPISRGAVESGAPGPTIYFAEGRGLRDKVRLLRITKSAEKEIISTVVEECDQDHVFAEMAKEGRLTEPGRGFIYTIPVDKGIIKIASVQSGAKYSASMQEIISAIDEMKGGKEWRGYNPIAQGAEGQQKDPFAKNKLHNLVSLTCVAPRDHAELLQDTALKAGAPAASTAFGKLRDDSNTEEQKGVHIHTEWGFIQVVLGPGSVDKVRDALTKAAAEHEIKDLCLYTLPVPMALTYLG